ncbi:hypothetical protein Pmani_000238 [Petrolisthes manimaculis]|uniref:Secreted protein n=1 Tax=Petrolisthes manimaculis TaxID=1843537 RepID=A0AAE1QQH1_9EUCA|nr:hypothetical protein Pmani_000238 [Petrolisthes manimaculis]
MFLLMGLMGSVVSVCHPRHRHSYNPQYLTLALTLQPSVPHPTALSTSPWPSVPHPTTLSTSPALTLQPSPRDLVPVLALCSNSQSLLSITALIPQPSPHNCHHCPNTTALTLALTPQPSPWP